MGLEIRQIPSGLGKIGDLGIEGTSLRQIPCLEDMKSRTTRAFRALLRKLPKSIRSEAKRAYNLFRENPAHPGLQFKCVQKNAKVYSVRISLNYRALGTLDGDEMIWMWIGSHADYDKLL
jgi:hypothetical protein